MTAHDEIRGTPFVVVETLHGASGPMEAVTCHMKDSAEVEAVQRGNFVVVVGKCEGKTLGIVHVGGCRVAHFGMDEGEFKAKWKALRGWMQND